MAEALDASPSTRRTNGASAQPVPRQRADHGSGAGARGIVRARGRPAARPAGGAGRAAGLGVDPAAGPPGRSRASRPSRVVRCTTSGCWAPSRSAAWPAVGLDDGAAMVGAALTRVLLAHERALAETNGQGPRRVLERLLRDGDVRDFLGVNRHRDVLWFSQERFDALVAGLLATAIALLTAPAAVSEAPAEDGAALLGSRPPGKPSARSRPPRSSPRRSRARTGARASRRRTRWRGRSATPRAPRTTSSNGCSTCCRSRQPADRGCHRSAACVSRAVMLRSSASASWSGARAPRSMS